MVSVIFFYSGNVTAVQRIKHLTVMNSGYTYLTQYLQKSTAFYNNSTFSLICRKFLLAKLFPQFNPKYAYKRTTFRMKTMYLGF